MHGDFTRDTFDATKGFLRVLQQQGRVPIDADPNEQNAIILYYLQTIVADLIGPHGGPSDNCGFAISNESNPKNLADLIIGQGRYYIGGLLCENMNPVGYDAQPYPPADKDQKLPRAPHLIYLDVWERHITSIEDDTIREVALGGPDTATRTKVMWQVKTLPLKEKADELKRKADGLTEKGDKQLKAELIAKHTDLEAILVEINKPNAFQAGFTSVDSMLIVDSLREVSQSALKAQARRGSTSDEPCVLPPDARYRGFENQLYRVEIHKGGDKDTATFKFSRENGSVCFPISSMEVQDLKIILKDLGQDARRGLEIGDWVEILDDDYTLQNRSDRPLLKVNAIEPLDMTVILEATESTAPFSPYDKDSKNHPLLRRWDQKEGASEKLSLTKAGTIKIKEGSSASDWIHLEDGVQIQFQPAALTQTYGRNYYRAGDYWLIPARTITGDVEWPGSADNPEARPPRSIQHHYAPLAIFKDDALEVKQDCRQVFGMLSRPVKPFA